MYTETAPIIEKWYKALSFDPKFDAEFYAALHTVSIPADTCIDTYPIDCKDGKKNLLAFLYMCEDLASAYQKQGIDRQILMDSLQDIVIWCNVWSKVTGQLYLGELHWLERTFRMRMYRLGRLQFCIDTADTHMTQFGLAEGETYLGVHIPTGGPLDMTECEKSFAMARGFFAKHYPDMEYRWFSCFSWLLDDTLQQFLPADSNILQFAGLFRVVEKKKADDIIRFMFGWDATREKVESWECRSGFAKAIQQAVREGTDFYEVRGLLPK